MTFGSILWELVAQTIRVPLTLTLAAVCSLVCFAVVARLRLPERTPPDASPGHRWPAPRLVREPAVEAGQVVVTHFIAESV